MDSAQSLETLLTNPTAAAAWQLRGDLLALGHASEGPTLQILRDYHHYLSSLAQATSAIEYTQLAYWLSAGAALVSFASDTIDQLNPFAILRNLLPKGLDEGLDILAAGNYLSSAEAMLPAVLQQAAWHLYDRYWQLAASVQPTQTAHERRQLLDRLFASFHAESRPMAQAVIISRLFQYALILSLNTG